jgi:hypothetical protein
MNYFKPWISDEGPKPPAGWGLDAARGAKLTHRCERCHGAISFQQQYIYSYTKDGLKVRHNTEECCASIIS